MYDIPPVDYWCEKNLSEKEYIFMKVKVISLMLAILAALSTSVSPLSLICNLLGHSVEEKNENVYTDDVCKCWR